MAMTVVPSAEDGVALDALRVRVKPGLGGGGCGGGGNSRPALLLDVEVVSVLLAADAVRALFRLR
jgi:hypothetical protein